ncbi:MAG: hypothetical protein DBX04_00240 [Candidatus Poseidoniales archaeon]|nr:MAG: hypothetical protein DBX04_00240 [Candidatus Poseidoniales archaeon]
MSHVGDCSLRWEEKIMEMDMNAMKAEIGGAFVVAWLVVGMGWGSLGAAVVMAAVWMAFSGAHVLPVITWMHMMTGDLADAEGNWMPNGMRLLAQIVGALLAILMMTEMGAIESTWDQVQPGFDAPDAWGAIMMVAAGAIFWTVHTRADSAWVTGFAVMALAGMMGMTYDVTTAAGDVVVSTTGAGEMASSIASSGHEVVAIAQAWIVDGLLCGLGALVAVKADEML